MSFVTLATIGCRALHVFFAGVASLAFVAGPGFAADVKRAVPASVLPSTASVADAPSGAEIVGKLLAKQTAASDPDVPLPQPNLSLHEPSEAPPSGPRIYGRGEDGGAVVGFRIPIPADRGVLQRSTRYGGAGTGSESP